MSGARRPTARKSWSAAQARSSDFWRRRQTRQRRSSPETAREDRMAPAPARMLQRREPITLSEVQPHMQILKRVNWVTAPFLLLTPTIAIVWGTLHVRTYGVHWFELALALFFLLATGISITAGYHRH